MRRKVKFKKIVLDYFNRYILVSTNKGSVRRPIFVSDVTSLNDYWDTVTIKAEMFDINIYTYENKFQATVYAYKSTEQQNYITYANPELEIPNERFLRKRI